MTRWDKSKAWFRAPDIPFSKDDANRFLPWIIMFMMLLTSVMLAFSLSLNVALHRWNSNLVNSFTVQIPQSESDNDFSADEVIALLRDNEWAESATLITRKDMQALIEPWLGDGAALEDLPLPMLIEVTVREGRMVNIEALERRLNALMPGAEIDDYAAWMSQFNRFSLWVQWGVFFLAMLIVIATLSIVVLAAKTALRLHSQTVEVLYTIGAQDTYIARQFQQNAMLLVLKGAVTGTVLAAIIYGLAVRYSSLVESPLLPALNLSIGHGVLFISLPLIMAAAALFSTRFAVISLLRHKP